jgi:signal transduction histidine kinase
VTAAVRPPGERGRAFLLTDRLAWRLSAGVLVVIVLTLAVVLVVLERATNAAFGTYQGHVAAMRPMMGTAEGLPDAQVFTDSVRRSLLAVGVVGAGLAGVVGVVIAQRLTRPLRMLQHATRAVAMGDTDIRVTDRWDGEIGELARDFNTMAAALAASSVARRRFLAGVAHELRTPLAILQAEIEALQDGVLEPSAEQLGALGDEVQLLGRVVGDLQVLSLADAGELRLDRRAESVATLLSAAVAPMDELAKRAGVTVTVDAAADLPMVLADRARFEQVTRNLLVNALRHTPRGGAVRVAAFPEADAVRVRVEDTGPGLPPEDLPRLFDRFAAPSAPAPASRAGSGLGLAIVRELVAGHGGTVRATNAPHGGARLEFTIPLAGQGAHVRAGGLVAR